MKKIILILSLLYSATFALDYNNYCTVYVPDKTASGIAMSTTGINSLARMIAQSEIAHALKKETNSKFSVKLDSFWGTNIAQGEFSKLTATTKNYSKNGLYAEKLYIETLCPYNKISYKDNKLNFDSNILLRYNAELNQDNLSKILKQNVRILNDKLVFDYKISVLGIKTTLSLKAGLNVTDNKIGLCNIEFYNTSINASKYLSYFNNLTNFKVDINKMAKANVKIDSVNIINSRVYVSGFVLIPET